MVQTKTCRKCGRELPISEFCKHRLSKDGHAWQCRECNRARSRQFRKTASGIYTSIKGRLKFKREHLERRGTPKTFSISRKDFIQWYNNQLKECVYCSIPEEKLSQWNDSHNNKVFRLTVDCMNNELGYVKGNLVLSCLRCNGIKSDLLSHEAMLEIGQKYIKPIWEGKLSSNRKVSKDEGNEVRR